MAALLSPPRIMELGPGRENPAARPALSALCDAEMFPGRTALDANLGRACRAGLWLLHDFLDESHQVSQSLETPEGSYFHAIMHRREPDPDNSKYWFRRLGRHAIFDPLARAAAERAAREPRLPEAARFLTTQATWNPARFVDLAESARVGQLDAKALCRDVGQIEWSLLFDFCWRAA